MKTLIKEITETIKPTNTNDAVDFILAGLGYFLKHHFKKTAIVLLLIFGSMLYVIIDYATTNKINIKDLKPIGAEFSIIPQAFAQTKQGKESIVIDGKYYGEADTNYIIYKMKTSNELVIYNKQYKYGFRYEIPALEKFRNSK